jgi:hypothetical protein
VLKGVVGGAIRVFRSVLFGLAAAVFSSPALADEIDRSGVGSWCYDPVRQPSDIEKLAFVGEVLLAARAAEQNGEFLLAF